MNLHLTRSLLLAVPLALGMWLSPAQADPIGILPTEPGSLPSEPPAGRGGSLSDPSSLVPIKIIGSGVISPNPNDVWDKVIHWDYSGDSISPGDVLCIDETITLFSSPSTSTPVALTDWEESFVPEVPDFTWHPTSSIKVNGVDAGAGQINGSQIRFEYAPVVPGIDAPVTLEIQKYITYTGDGPITSGGGSAVISFLVREQPSVPEPSGLIPLALGSCWITRRRKR